MYFSLKAVAAAASLTLFAAFAQAGVNTISIEFNPAALSNYNGGDSFTDGDFRFTAVDPYTGTGFAGFGSAAGSCNTTYVCPTRTSAYYGVVNDGAVRMERSDGGSFSLAGFDAGFIAPLFDLSLTGPVGKLVVQGVGAAGVTTAEFGLQGLDFNGGSSFFHFDFDSLFSSTAFSSVSFTSCIDDGMGNCTVGNSFNLGQFGLDSIHVIPEPASLALVGLGLLGVASTRRRKA